MKKLLVLTILSVSILTGCGSTIKKPFSQLIPLESDPEFLKQKFIEFTDTSYVFGKGMAEYKATCSEAYELAKIEAYKDLSDAILIEINSNQELIQLEATLRGKSSLDEIFNQTVNTSSINVIPLAKDITKPLQIINYDKKNNKLQYSIFLTRGVPRSAASNYIIKTIALQHQSIDSLKDELKKNKKEFQRLIDNETDDQKINTLQAELEKISASETRYDKISNRLDSLNSDKKAWEDKIQKIWSNRPSETEMMIAQTRNVLIDKIDSLKIYIDSIAKRIPPVTIPSPKESLDMKLLTNCIFYDISKTNFNDSKYAKTNVEIISAITDYLAKNISKISQIRIDGYSDKWPHKRMTYPEFGEQRALFLKNYMVNKGIPEGKIVIRGLGPFSSNLELDSYYNRRVEIYVSESKANF